MAKNKQEVMNMHIEPYTLTKKEMKEKIESFITYEESKYPDCEILFTNKGNNIYKLPFSDFKVAIAQELEEQKLLLEELQSSNLIQENVYEEPVEEETIEVEEEPTISVLDEIYEFEDESKKPSRERNRSRIKQVDTEAIVARIKAEAKEKNKGKKVTTRRDINKELKPYLLKKANENAVNDDVLTSIDIYLNAVSKIEADPNETVNINDTTATPNLDDILNDLEK